MNQTISLDLDSTLLQITHQLFPQALLRAMDDDPSRLRPLLEIHRARLVQQDHRAYDWQELTHQAAAPAYRQVLLEHQAELEAEGAEVSSVLSTLKAGGYTLLVATNGYAVFQRMVLEITGLTSYFDDLICPDTVGVAKPDPTFWRRVPRDSWHVGDSAVCDVYGASSAGLKAAWLNISRTTFNEAFAHEAPGFGLSNAEPQNPHAVLEQLTALPSMLHSC